jgi:hypothetical protein
VTMPSLPDRRHDSNIFARTLDTITCITPACSSGSPRCSADQARHVRGPRPADRAALRHGRCARRRNQDLLAHHLTLAGHRRPVLR